MSTSTAKVKKSNDDYIKNELKELRKENAMLTSTINVMKGLLINIDQKVSDLSTKRDITYATLGVANKPVTKSKAGSSKDDSAKPKLNIMSYFKLKYKMSIQTKPSNDISQEEITEAKKIMNDIFPDANTIQNLFEEHSSELNNKKVGEPLDKARAALIYTHLIKPNKSITDQLRSIKDTEETRNLNVTPEIVEQNLDEEEVEIETVGEEEDSDSD